MSNRTRIHWLAPASMVGAILGGVLFAVGHHIFYQSLAGSTASTADYSIFGSSISRQETNIAIGTAFAFLVKASLVFAMSVAYIQACWRQARVATDGTTLANLDAIFSALSNAHALLNVPVWCRYPILLLMAGSAWLVPIASIITPATLSIQNGRASPDPIRLHAVPNLDFRNLNFVADLQAGQPTETDTYLYGGPSHGLMSAANAVMAQGAILPISPPQPNSSWTVEFAGPSLVCENFNETRYRRIQENYDAMTLTAQNCLGIYPFLAWFPTSGYSERSEETDVPFIPDSQNHSMPFIEGSIWSSSNGWLDQPGSYLTMDIFVASPSMIQFYQDDGLSEYCEKPENGSRRGYPDWVQATMLQCRLFNSTYEVLFNYTDGTQAVDINTQIINGSNPMPSLTSLYGPFINGTPNHTYATCPNLEFSGPLNSSTDPCFVNPEVLSALSYQAIMDAFTSNIAGSISWYTEAVPHTASDIVKTALLNTNEFSILGANGEPRMQPETSLQQALAEFNTSNVMGLTNAGTASSNLSLADALEEMFRNLTVSLMAIPSLQPNRSLETAPPPTNVTFPTYHNIYVYSKWKLWTAYGAATLVAVLVVVFGFVAMILDGASYSNNFSTIFRAARGAELDVLIDDDDLDAKDPLPKDLAKARVSLRERITNDEDETPSTQGSPPNAQKRPTARSRRLN